MARYEKTVDVIKKTEEKCSAIFCFGHERLFNHFMIPKVLIILVYLLKFILGVISTINANIYTSLSLAFKLIVLREYLINI